MTSFFDKYFNRAYLVVCAIVFIIVCLRAFFIPFSHDESFTFFFYVQSNNYLPYKAHVYTNNHVLNSALANLCYHIAGSHRFVLRIPNIFSFVLLCFGTYRFFRDMKSVSSKIILTCFFILTFNFLDFFELCRGYGLSMALMVLSLSYLQDYFSTKKFGSLLAWSVYWQLALSANLTLVVLTVFMLSFILIFQWKEKLIFEKKNLLLQTINFFIVLFWLKFSFFYRAKGVLDSGSGDNYWEVSFKSLMLFIFGTNELWMQVLLIIILSIVFIFTVFQFFRKPFSLNKTFNPGFFYLIFFTVLVVSFYLMKKLLNVNYPEDRTGLFFYIFFALSLVFFFDSISKIISSFFAGILFVSSVNYFIISVNLSSFTHFFYHVLPKEFYTCLENEYEKDPRVFTIGGHMNREMNYAFVNYRAGGKLNQMDDPAQMTMNCDYYIALAGDKPYYSPFYDELSYDPIWDRVLLKRRQQIERSEVVEMTRGAKYFTGSDEFFEFLKQSDSSSLLKNCIEADVEIYFKKVHKPFKAFLVLQVEDEKGGAICYKRALLNWLDDDLSGQTRHIKLTSSPFMGSGNKVIVYLWNIDKKECEIELKHLKILNLSASGINVLAPLNTSPL